MLDWADGADMERQERFWIALQQVRWGVCVRAALVVFWLGFLAWLGSR